MNTKDTHILSSQDRGLIITIVKDILSDELKNFSISIDEDYTTINCSMNEVEWKEYHYTFWISGPVREIEVFECIYSDTPFQFSWHLSYLIFDELRHDIDSQIMHKLWGDRSELEKRYSQGWSAAVGANDD